MLPLHRYGVSPGQAFDNIVGHIAEQTKLDSKDPITVRLNKIAANPFKNWKYPIKVKNTRISYKATMRMTRRLKKAIIKKHRSVNKY